MAELRWTDEAVRWLEEIRDYIAQDDPAAARRVIAGIYERAQVLRDYPAIGYKYRDEAEGEIRILLYGHYRIAYLIKYDVAEILGIFHGAMNIDRYLNRP
jgi:plasmid stabilization system protein ParE